MANVIIEELDSISEDSFATGESDRSVDDFHDLETEVPRTTDAASSRTREGQSPNKVSDGSVSEPEEQLTGDALGKASNSSVDALDLREGMPNGSQEGKPDGQEVTVPPEDPALLAKAIEEADKLKAEGNKLYTDGQFLEARDVYKQALDGLPEGASQLRAVLFANSAAVRIKLEEYAEAAKDCSAALALEPPQPLQVKALTRRSMAYEKLDDLDRALADYEKLVSLDSSNLASKAAVRRLKPIVEERREKMKEEMIGKLKDLGNTVLGKFGMSLDNFKAEKDPNTGSYSINFKQ